MAETENGTEAIGGGDDTQQAFAERWEGLSDADRSKEARDLFLSTRGLNRKVTALQAEIGELQGAKQSANETTEKVVSSLSELRNEIAEARAIAKLNKITGELLQRAIDGNLDPKVAVSVAGSDDPIAALDAIEAEIDRKADEQVNTRLGAIPAPKGSPLGESGYDISRMSQNEINRMPPSLRNQAFENYVEGAING